jgi:hypothetical protein
LVTWLPEKFDEIENSYYGGDRDSFVGAVSSFRRCKASAATSFLSAYEPFSSYGAFGALFAHPREGRGMSEQVRRKQGARSGVGTEKTKNDHLRENCSLETN